MTIKFEGTKMTRAKVADEYHNGAITREEYGLLMSLDESDLAQLVAAYDDGENGLPNFIGLGFVWEHGGEKHFTKWSDEKRSEIIFRLEQIQRDRVDKVLADQVSHEREKRANMSYTYGYRPQQKGRSGPGFKSTAWEAAYGSATHGHNAPPDSGYAEMLRKMKEDELRRAQAAYNAGAKTTKETVDEFYKTSAAGEAWQRQMCNPNYTATPEEVKRMRLIHGDEWGTDHYDAEGRVVGYTYGGQQAGAEPDPKSKVRWTATSGPGADILGESLTLEKLEAMLRSVGRDKHGNDWSHFNLHFKKDKFGPADFNP